MHTSSLVYSVYLQGPHSDVVKEILFLSLISFEVFLYFYFLNCGIANVKLEGTDL